MVRLLMKYNVAVEIIGGLILAYLIINFFHILAYIILGILILAIFVGLANITEDFSKFPKL